MMRDALPAPAGAMLITTSLGYLFSTFTVLGPRPGRLMRLPLASCRLASGPDGGRNCAIVYACAGSAVASAWITERSAPAAGDRAIWADAAEPPQICFLV